MRRVIAVVVSAGAAGCAAGAPPYTEGPAPGPPLAANASASPRAPELPPAVSNGESPESLTRVTVTGPHASLESICGAGCAVGPSLPTIPPLDQVAIAVGTDPRDRQPAGVETTFLVVRAGAEWYGTFLFRDGAGVTHLEVFNPPDVNRGSPSRVDRPAVFSGAVVSTEVLTREGAPSRGPTGASTQVIAVTMTRSNGTASNVLQLCEVTGARGLRCAELETGSELSIAKKALAGDLLRVTFSDGAASSYGVFGDPAPSSPVDASEASP